MAHAATVATRDGGRAGERAAARRTRNSRVRRARIAVRHRRAVVCATRRWPRQSWSSQGCCAAAARAWWAAAWPSRRRHFRVAARSRQRLSHHRFDAHRGRIGCERGDRLGCRTCCCAVGRCWPSRPSADRCAHDRRVRDRRSSAGECLAGGRDGPGGGACSCDRTATPRLAGVVCGGAVSDLHRSHAVAQRRVCVVGRGHRVTAGVSAAVACPHGAARPGLAGRRARRPDCRDAGLRAAHRVDLGADQPGVDSGEPARRTRRRAGDGSRRHHRCGGAAVDASRPSDCARRRSAVRLAGLGGAHVCANAGRGGALAEWVRRGVRTARVDACRSCRCGCAQIPAHRSLVAANRRPARGVRCCGRAGDGQLRDCQPIGSAAMAAARLGHGGLRRRAGCGDRRAGRAGRGRARRCGHCTCRGRQVFDRAWHLPVAIDRAHRRIGGRCWRPPRRIPCANGRRRRYQFNSGARCGRSRHRVDGGGARCTRHCWVGRGARHRRAALASDCRVRDQPGC